MASKPQQKPNYHDQQIQCKQTKVFVNRLKKKLSQKFDFFEINDICVHINKIKFMASQF